MAKLGVVGVGSMGGALTGAVCRTIDPEDVLIYDTATEHCKNVSEANGCRMAADLCELAADSEVILMAVKPYQLDTVFREMMPEFRKNYEEGKRQIVLSVAAGWSIEDLERAFEGMDMPVIRLMPNIPVRIGQGVILFSNNRFATDDETDRVMKMFAGAGMCEHTGEEVIAAATPAFSCSPAMVYMFIEAMVEGSVEVGLERGQATKLAAQAVLGSAALVLEGKKHVSALKDELCIPNSMTICGTNLMERRGFRSAVIDAIKAQYEHQFEMQK